MLVHVYRVIAEQDRVFYVMLREDDYSITLSLRTVNRIRNDETELPVFTDVAVYALFLDEDDEIKLVDTVPQEEVSGFLKMYAMMIGEK